MRQKFAGLALSLAVLSGLPLAVQAQTVPCISCDIAEQNAAIQAATNRAIVQQQLQSNLQMQINVQQNTMLRQQLLNTLQMQSSLSQNDWALRQILLQEQLNILKLEASQRAAKTHAKKAPHKAR